MRRSALGGVVTYITYAAGMGVVILTLSVSAALAHDSLVGSLRSLSRWAPRLAGLLLVVSGLYAIWYGRHRSASTAAISVRMIYVEFGLDLPTAFYPAH